MKLMLKLALFTLPFFSASALVEAEVNENAPLSVEFSSRAHNRISVKEGSITKVIGDDNLFQVSIDKTVCQAFITLKKEIGEFPATLTIVTGLGSVQDLVVTSNPEKQSEFVVLKEVSLESDEDYAPPKAPHGDSIEFLNKVLSGGIPEGYGSCPIAASDNLVLPKPLDMVAIRALEGPFERVVVYRLVNTKKRLIQIDRKTLKGPQDFWVFLGNTQIDGNSETVCVISTSKEAKAQ